MKNIFKFLSNSKLAVAVIVLLLIVQAYCDLALPSYTSDLLNIGLQQGGLRMQCRKRCGPRALNC